MMNQEEDRKKVWEREEISDQLRRRRGGGVWRDEGEIDDVMGRGDGDRDWAGWGGGKYKGLGE